ncbi:hypothetical protein [Nonomuraea sp. NPDC005650]|uniref:hypothetical protein n=1 Tax=Nonomuraea sp. NPDC005650 TaxID=3157045 RepID=UPI0033BAF647
MIAVYVVVGVFALIGVLVTAIVLLVLASTVLDLRRDRCRVEFDRLADPTPAPDLDDPSLGGLVIEVPTRLRRQQ